jgi:hypothetical protein
MGTIRNRVLLPAAAALSALAPLPLAAAATAHPATAATVNVKAGEF